MKMKYLFHGLLASILLITACQEPDDLVRSDSENINILSVKGSLISDADKQYDAIVDEANGTITVQVPYYISDTEKIQGDLTQMKVTANMPTGARFEPEISGIHDLVAGFQSTLIKHLPPLMLLYVRHNYLPHHGLLLNQQLWIQKVILI